jgi:hypothetical protein
VGIFATKRLKRLPLYLTLCLTPLGAIAVAQALSSSHGPTATPFIAAENPQTKNFNAVATHYGRRNPYLLSTNSSSVEQNSHCGVVINSGGDPGLRSFDTFSFSYKGSPETRAFVTYKPPVGSFITRFLTIREGSPGQQTKDGFKRVTFSKEQWSIDPGSSIKEIAIIPPAKKDAGVFKVDAISLDDNPVKRILSTVFYETNSGPAGASAQVIVPPEYYTKQTGVVFRNSSGQDVYVWVTLGGGKSVQSSFPYYGANGSKTSPVTWTTVGSTSHAYALLPLQSGAAPSAIYSKKGLGNFTGNVTFSPTSLGTTVDPTSNCPSLTYPCGHTQVEWALNQGKSGNEAANVSCNNGVNAQITMNYRYNGGTADPSTPGSCSGFNPSPCWAISNGNPPTYPATVTNSGTLTANNTINGVYPYNAPCGGAPTCISPPPQNCNYLYPSTFCSYPNNTCTFPFSGPAIAGPFGNASASNVQVARAAGVKGGAVHIIVNGFTISCN